MNKNNEYGIPTIIPFHFWSQHVLPLVYDDSLSYLEVLEKVKIKLNEVIDNINSWSDVIKNYTDQQIGLLRTELKTYIDQQDSLITSNLTELMGGLEQRVNNALAINQQEMEQLKADYQESDRQLRQWVTEQLLDINQQFMEFENSVNATIAWLKNYIDNGDEEGIRYTDKEIKRLEDIIKNIQINPVQMVICPVDGKVESIQKALDDMWYSLNVWALTAIEYDTLLIPAEEYDNYQLSAWQYDFLARWYLMFKRNIKYWIKNEIKEFKDYYDNKINDFNPFSGRVDTLINIIRGITNIIRLDGISAYDYDKLQLEAGQYDSWSNTDAGITNGLTAFLYDWYGSILLGSRTRGLEAEIYDGLMLQGTHVVSDALLNQEIASITQII